MKKQTILYRVFTGLFSFLMFGSAIPDILMAPEAVEGIHGQLGYPLYFIPFIGVAKILGVLAILLPISHKVKEWAYAGLIFDLVGASFSIIASGLESNAIFMILPLALAVASYILYTKRKGAKKVAYLGNGAVLSNAA